MIFLLRKYLSTGLAIVAMIMTSYAVIQYLHNKVLRSEMELVKAEKSLLLDINDRQSKAIDQVIAQNKIDDSVVSMLRKIEGDLNSSSQLWTLHLEELINADPETDDYLNTIIPDPLGRLLDNAPAESDNSNPD